MGRCRAASKVRPTYSSKLGTFLLCLPAEARQRRTAYTDIKSPSISFQIAEPHDHVPILHVRQAQTKRAAPCGTALPSAGASRHPQNCRLNDLSEPKQSVKLNYLSSTVPPAASILHFIFSCSATVRYYITGFVSSAFSREYLDVTFIHEKSSHLTTKREFITLLDTICVIHFLSEYVLPWWSNGQRG